MHVRVASWEEDYDCIRLVRMAVFCREQSIPQEIDFDGLDPGCRHVLAFTNSGEPIGTARMQKDGHLGRIAVLKEWRNRGVGKALVTALITAARDEGLSQVYLNAQVHAVPFYEELGFRSEGEAFYEAGIEHCRMTKKFEVSEVLKGFQSPGRK
jgi:predicted GNAT family N-acyltransferase